MLQNNLRHLLVIDDNTNKPVGIITPLDFIRNTQLMRIKIQWKRYFSVRRRQRQWWWWC
jgi:hypothetical protein